MAVDVSQYGAEEVRFEINTWAAGFGTLHLYQGDGLEEDTHILMSKQEWAQLKARVDELWGLNVGT